MNEDKLAVWEYLVVVANEWEDGPVEYADTYLVFFKENGYDKLSPAQKVRLWEAVGKHALMDEDTLAAAADSCFVEWGLSGYLFGLGKPTVERDLSHMEQDHHIATQGSNDRGSE